MAEPKKVYWDACVWLSLINGEADRIGRCQYQIDLAQKGDVQIWTSSLSLAEVFKKKCSGENISLAETKDEDFERFMEQDFVYEVQVDHDISVLARRLLRKNPELKKPNDAVHLATAVLNNVDELHTFDGDNLLSLDGKIDRRDGKKLVICEPPTPTNQQLNLILTPLDEVPEDIEGGNDPLARK